MISGCLILFTYRGSARTNVQEVDTSSGMGSIGWVCCREAR